MFIKRILFALIFVGASQAALGAEVLMLPFKSGKPDAAEFRLAAVRAFYKRNYEVTIIDPQRVVAVYRGGVSMEIALRDAGVAIRNVTGGSLNANYARNLQRDLVYELAAYMISAPSSEQQAAGGQADGPNKADVSGLYLDNFDQEIRLKQNGSQISGYIDSPQYENTIKGARVGDEITFTFRNSQGGFAHKKGKGKITISEDGRTLTGHRSGGRFPNNSPWTLKYESPL